VLASGRGRALARASLAGNPSDLYGGAVLAVTLPAWVAEVLVAPARRQRVEPPSQLIEATVRRFARELHARGSRVTVRWRSSIPLAVGLGGSSALVIATSRALCQHSGAQLGPDALAEFALAVETEELGLTAGPQDRFAQAHEGLTFMDFSGPCATCETLDPAHLPPMLIAWREQNRRASGEIHAPVRERFAAGSPELAGAVVGLTDAARAAAAALRSGDHRTFATAMDQSLDWRGRLMELDPGTFEMVQTARATGAAANYAGSGGAISVVPATVEKLSATAGALRDIGSEVLTCGSPSRVG
jgi:glucuronokinase